MQNTLFGEPYPTTNPADSPKKKTMMEEIIAQPIDFNYKSRQQRVIDGEFGTTQMGVVRYPYAPLQKLYKSDFRAIVSHTLTHPYCNTAVPGAGSLPFNILSGSNFDDDKVNAAANWVSEQERMFVRKSLLAGKSIEPTGIRTECQF